VSLLVALIAAEGFLRLAFPQESMYPRWNFSARYCSALYKDTIMVHQKPGRWRFTYSVNEYEYRGRSVPFSALSGKKNIVLLGDSYTFGNGGNDGEEFASVLAGEMWRKYNVVNLGVGGWGLTQEIRRYYDFGARYRPHIVILQFSANDPRDDLRCPVTIVSAGRFVFHNAEIGVHGIKQYLSHSIIQKSQVYNLVRNSLYLLFENHEVDSARASLVGARDDPGIPVEEKMYVDLLDAFARDLHRSGSKMIFLTVNSQLHTFPHIETKVLDLESAGLLKFFDAADWLRNMTHYESPEGHLWGKKAHQVIGERLAEIVRDEDRGSFHSVALRP